MDLLRNCRGGARRCPPAKENISPSVFVRDRNNKNKRRRFDPLYHEYENIYECANSLDRNRRCGYEKLFK